MPSKSFLGNMIVVEAVAASSVLMGEIGTSRDLFAILFLVGLKLGGYVIGCVRHVKVKVV